MVTELLFETVQNYCLKNVEVESCLNENHHENGSIYLWKEGEKQENR